MLQKGYSILLIVLLVIMIGASCAPKDQRWDQEINPGHKAGFWAGIWHGFIIIITFIISLFTHQVGIYETNNTGWLYNLGFIIGLLFSLGGGIRVGTRRRRLRKKDWDRINERVEVKVKQGIQSWLNEAEKKEKEKEWEEIAKKIEEKIKRTLEEWVEK
jgi:hypothetical protein